MLRSCWKVSYLIKTPLAIPTTALPTGPPAIISSSSWASSVFTSYTGWYLHFLRGVFTKSVTWHSMSLICIDQSQVACSRATGRNTPWATSRSRISNLTQVCEKISHNPCGSLLYINDVLHRYLPRIPSGRYPLRWIVDAPRTRARRAAASISCLKATANEIDLRLRTCPPSNIGGWFTREMVFVAEDDCRRIDRQV